MITPSFGLTATERVLPRLALDFTTATLDARVTFARTGATATRVNSNGNIEIVAANTPRFDYDPVTLVIKGLLIEEARANFALQSQNFGATWSPTNVTIAAGVVSPDGANNSDRIVETAVNSVHIVDQSVASLTIGQTYRFSVYVKAAERSFIAMQLSTGFTNTPGTYFNSANGTIGTTFSGAPVPQIENAGNGWYRCSIQAVAAATTGLIVIYLASANGTVVYTGNTNNGINLWGAQLEAGTFATSYIPTTTAAVTRNADVASMTGTNFSDWYNPTEGAFNVGFMFNTEPGLTSGGASQRALFISDGTTNNRMDVTRIETSSDRMFLVVQAAGSLDVFGAVNTLNTTNNTLYNLCFAYKQNSVAAAISGLSPLTDTSVSIPVVNQLRFGALSAVAGFINGHITNMEYYPQRLTTNEVQAFSKG